MPNSQGAVIHLMCPILQLVLWKVKEMIEYLKLKNRPSNLRGVALCEGRKECGGSNLDLQSDYRNLTESGPQGFHISIPFPLSSRWPRTHTLGEISFQPLVKFIVLNLETQYG